MDTESFVTVLASPIRCRLLHVYAEEADSKEGILRNISYDKAWRQLFVVFFVRLLSYISIYLIHILYFQLHTLRSVSLEGIPLHIREFGFNL